MNTPKWEGIARHVVNTLGTVLLTLAGLSLLPSKVSSVLTPENVDILKAAIISILGSGGLIWSIFKSTKAPEKQISSEDYNALVSKLKDKQ